MQQVLREKGKLTYDELYFLVHSALMHKMLDWAEERQVPVADVIKKMGAERDALLSWVHLNAKGNRIIAEALAEEILPLTCPLRAPVKDSEDRSAARSPRLSD